MPVASLAIDGVPSGPLLVGSTTRLFAVARDASGALLADRAVTWSSSNELVARVEATGLVSGVGAGQATITGAAEGKSTSATLDFRLGGAMGVEGGTIAVLGGTVTLIVPPSAVSVPVILTVLQSSAAPADVRLADGKAYQLGPQDLTLSRPATLQLKYDRSRLPFGTSEGSLLLGVLSGGTWIPVPGSVVDVATGSVSGAITRTGTYAVLSAAVDHVIITGVPASGQLYVGQSAQLAATPYDASNNALAGRPTTWTSSDPSKIAVSGSGRASVLDVGSSTLTATIEGKTGSTTIIAKLVPIASISVTPSMGALYAGGTLQLTVVTKDSAGGVLTGRPIAWTSSDVQRATVDSNGTVTSVGTGSVAITATSEQKSALANLTVLPAVVADWSLASEWTTFQGNASHTGYVTATVDPTRFREQWTATVLAGSALNPVTTGDGNVLVSTQAYYGKQLLSVLDAATGTAKWTYDFGAIHAVDPPAYANGVVYAQTSGHGDSFLWAFDASTGSIRFRSAYGNQWSRYYAPVIVDQSVYFGGGTYGGMYSFNLADGSQKWFAGLNQYDQFTPAVKDGLVYAYTGSYSPKLTVANAATGVVTYEIADPNFVWNGWSMDIAPALGGSNNVLATQGNRLVSFDLTARRVGWEKTGTYTGNVSVAGGRVYVFNNRQLEVRAEADGALLWLWVPPEGAPTGTTIVTSNLIFVSTAANTYAIDLASHQVVWRYPAGGYLALGQRGQLLIAQGNGKLTAIGVK